MTLNDLKKHAAIHATREFQMLSCTNCLAAFLTDRVMHGHEKMEDGSPVPPELSKLTWGMSSAAKAEATFTGAELLALFARIEAGGDPHAIGYQAVVDKLGTTDQEKEQSDDPGP